MKNKNSAMLIIISELKEKTAFLGVYLKPQKTLFS